MGLAFLFGALGALIAEAIKRWDQFASMPDERFNLLLKSFKVWSAIVLLVVVGGLGGVFSFQQAVNASWQFFFVSGAGMMLFVRNIVSAAAKHRPERLGAESVDEREKSRAQITLSDCFN